MYKLSALYKNVIQSMTGVKNEIEFAALMLICEEYFSAKEDEDIKCSKQAENDDEDYDDYDE